MGLNRLRVVPALMRLRLQLLGHKSQLLKETFS